jgi:SAM-dependent methyltransferase
MRPRCGFYERRVFPWLNDKFNAAPALQRLRAEAVANAHGRVVEIGFGTGLNLAHYPRAVTSVVAVEPNDGMHVRAIERIRAAPVPVEFVAGSAEQLPLADRTFDTAVSVLTLCSVSDPALTLRELHRVLRDDGRLLVLEHGLAEAPGVARWQARLNPIQKTLACGCHLTRPIEPLVEAGGFRFVSLRKFFAPEMPRTHGWLTLGTAEKA